MKKLFALTLLVVAGGANAAHVIDNFSDGAYSTSILAGTDLNWQNGTMIGGIRGTELTVDSNPLNQPLQLSIGSGGLSIINSGTLTDGRLTLHYGYTSGFGNNDLNKNFNSNGWDRLSFAFLANDNPMTMTVTLRTTSGGVSTSTANIAGGQMSAFTQDFFFSGFSGGANFNDIDSMSFLFDTGPSGDFALDSVQLVPEPASMIALASALGALAARRRRK